MPRRPAMAVRWIDRIGRAAERHQHAQRVLDGLFGDDLSDGRIGVPISPTAARPRCLRRRPAARNAPPGSPPSPAAPSPASRRCRPCVLAVPITAQVPAVTDRLPSTVAISSAIDAAGAIARPEAAAIGAGAEPLARWRPVLIGPVTSWIAGTIGRQRAHQLRRHGLVAAADQHHRVHRLGADHLLGVHRHQVAEHHAGRAEEHLAQRDGRERQRQRAGRQHAARHRLDQLRHQAMAVVEAEGVIAMPTTGLPSSSGEMPVERAKERRR